MQLLGQGIGPMNTVHVRAQGVALAFAQAAREVDDGVAPQRLPPFGQRLDHLQGERAGAGAELPHLVGAAGGQRLRHLPRQGLAEQRGEFGAVTKSLPPWGRWPNFASALA